MKLLAAALFWLVAACAFGVVDPGQVAVPPLTARVTDLTGTVTPQQQAALEQALRDFEQAKGSQIAILIVPTTGTESIEQYSIRVVDQWKLGRAKVDDGALLIVAKDDRTMRIEVGYGLEGVLPDAICERIISEIITPKFKTGDYYGGLKDGTGQMMQIINGEPLPQAVAKNNDISNSPSPFFALVAILMVGRVLRRVIGRFPGAVVTGALGALMAWLIVGTFMVSVMAALLAFAFTLLGGGLLLPMMGLPGGSGGNRGGGFGGGSFGGGGGGFGGGGASGRW
jgi:uncharacterized protein